MEKLRLNTPEKDAIEGSFREDRVQVIKRHGLNILLIFVGVLKMIISLLHLHKLEHLDEILAKSLGLSATITMGEDWINRVSIIKLEVLLNTSYDFVLGFVLVLVVFRSMLLGPLLTRFWMVFATIGFFSTSVVYMYAASLGVDQSAEFIRSVVFHLLQISLIWMLLRKLKELKLRGQAEEIHDSDLEIKCPNKNDPQELDLDDKKEDFPYSSIYLY